MRWAMVRLFVAGLAAALGPAARAGLREDFQDLVKARDGLRAALEARQAADAKAGPAADFHLHLAGGADGADLDLVLCRAAGRWQAAYAEVPAWEQSTMQEWRGYHLGNGVGSAWRPTRRFAVDASALAAGAGLTGPVGVAVRLDQTLQERFPPGEPCSWWDRFIPAGLTVPRRQTYTLDARVADDAWLFDMVIEGGVHWDPAKTGSNRGTGGLVERPILARVLVPGTRFTAIQVKTPTWNGGWHEGDAQGLTFKDDRLRGSLIIMLHQDGWVPWGGGKTWQHPPQILTFQVDARLAHHRLDGTYKATGDMGDFEGGVRGRGGPAVIGRFQGEGELGPCVGPVLGMVLADHAPPAEQVSDQPPLPPDEAAAARQAAGRINPLLHDIRALHLALQHDPLPLSEALTQTDAAAPVWPDAAQTDPAAVAAYVAEALRLVRAAGDPAKAALPEARAEACGESPSTGAAGLPVSDGGASTLPADAEPGWHVVTAWRAIGPFEQRLGLEHDDAFIADVVAAVNLAHRQATDRFGAARRDAATQVWQTVAAEDGKIAPPWEKAGFYTRFAGQVWYARADLRTEKAQRLWFAVESSHHAKLWVNGRLVWVGPEKTWRYRARGRAIVPVDLAAGGNDLLVRAHRDRRPSWVRLALTTREPAPGGAEPAGGAFAGPFVYPDARPPLAWDLEAGINVAWRAADLAGKGRPAVAGDAVFVTADSHTLACADAATGRVRWSAEAKGDRPPAPKAAASEPVTDGRHVWFQGGSGEAACYDASGRRLWQCTTNLASARLHLYKGRLAIEGDPTDAWPAPEGSADRTKGRRREAATGIVLLDAGSGEALGTWTVPGRFEPKHSRFVTCGGGGDERGLVWTSVGPVLDVAGARLLPPMDVERPDEGRRGAWSTGYPAGAGYWVTAAPGRIYLTSEDQGVAVRLWTVGDRPAYAMAWETGYEHGGFGRIVTPAVATNEYLFTWNPVLERGPHCPDPRLEVQAYDAATGRPLAKLKPALVQAVTHAIHPVVAGPYLFCQDAGGGTHGGSPYGQVVVATADAELQLVARNRIDLGTAAPPVFAGDRMFLRGPAGLVCIAVTTPEGKAYQARRLAETLLEELGPPPEAATPRRIAPMKDGPPGGDRPDDELLDGRAPEFWLGAGPLPAEGADEAALAALRPRAGSEVTVAGRTVAFRPLSRQFACNEPPRYRREFSLQGTGDIVPTFSTKVDPRCVSGPSQGMGLLYTVLDNRRDRVVVPVPAAPGITEWLSGERLRPDEPLHLGPGLYPLLVRVGPGYYEGRDRAAIPPWAAKSPPAEGQAKPPEPDYRLAPALKEVPHPQVRMDRWLRRAEARRDRLEAVLRDLPGTSEARTAETCLARLKR